MGALESVGAVLVSDRRPQCSSMPSGTSGVRVRVRVRALAVPCSAVDVDLARSFQGGEALVSAIDKLDTVDIDCARP